MKNLFRIKRHEYIPTATAAILFVLLNTLNVLKFYDRFSVVVKNYHDLFWGTYHVSGYDLITYNTVSKWDVIYEVTRHPLMAFFMFVPAEINQMLISLTGSNWATVIVGILWAVCAVYAFIFIFRILYEIMEVGYKSACLLCALLYSFGFMMVSTFVPDHFGPSVMLLLLVIYIAGIKNKQGKELNTCQTIILFTFTAGITLSNGIKVFLAALINKGKNFFTPKYLFLAVIIPSAALFGFSQLEQSIFIQPKTDAAKRAMAASEKKWKDELRKTYCDTTTIKDSAQIAANVKKLIHDKVIKDYRERHNKPWYKHAGKPMAKTGFASWTDISTPRLASLVENVFGDPIQIHEDYFLEDVNLGRPVIIEYNHWYNYLAEGALMCLVLFGIWIGRRDKIIWMALSFFGFDMLIHLVLGFGLNEVYIMSPHYLFIIPIAIAPLIKRWTKATVSSVSMLTIWFAYWNLSLLIPFLTALP